MITSFYLLFVEANAYFSTSSTDKTFVLIELASFGYSNSEKLNNSYNLALVSLATYNYFSSYSLNYLYFSLAYYSSDISS